MRVLNNNILIKELQNNGNTTPEGVIMPDTIKLGYEIGAVIAVSEAAIEDPASMTLEQKVQLLEKRPNVREGNLIAYHANSGVRIMLEGEACRFILEGNVLAVLEENVIEGAPPTEH